MNKPELIAEVADHAGLTRKQAAAAIEAFTALLMAEMRLQGQAKLPGFGSFRAVEAKARTVFGAAGTVEVPAKLRAKFLPTSELKQALAARKAEMEG